ncbi:hypothetical protein E2C01_096729 [Portunus trituberculatus]|uniref:Uncharacterized protein n=1 Tax=Portunus trituberculatus TaxID=210409 RepID=A0A5B7JWD1_PORTR|nr:hypothetical protein [Portunus trituberculatus]
MTGTPLTRPTLGTALRILCSRCIPKKARYSPLAWSGREGE